MDELELVRDLQSAQQLLLVERHFGFRVSDDP